MERLRVARPRTNNDGPIQPILDLPAKVRVVPVAAVLRGLPPVPEPAAGEDGVLRDAGDAVGPGGSALFDAWAVSTYCIALIGERRGLPWK